MTSYEYLAKIFRAKPEIIVEMDKKMEAITSKKGVLDEIVKENEQKISKTLTLLNCRDYSAENVFRSLITKLQRDDREIYDLFGKPSGTTIEGLKKLFDTASELADLSPLFVLKRNVAEEILRKNPPPNIMEALDYKDIEELLAKEDLFEVFAALRFVENNEWMHKTFDGTYKDLTANDFEERKIDLRVLSEKWLKIAEKFVKKKYHNISHLKELGVIFVIPIKIDTPGETLRLFSLVLHYLYEIDFYCKLFKKASLSAGFGQKIISLLKGEVVEGNKDENKMIWPIIQRYLAKDDPNDPRLFIPHVNPEALHWKKAEQKISNLSKKFNRVDLEMWFDLDWVGGFFDKKDGSKDLVSFDLVDTVMALVQKEQRVKYLYHHQEALWNEIFERYMGSENLEILMVNNFDKGYIEL